MRETAAVKATRLLGHGRLAISRVDRRGVTADVRGDSAEVYRVEHRSGRWTCTCPAIGPCSHAIAVQRVVVIPRSPGDSEPPIDDDRASLDAAAPPEDPFDGL